MRLKVVAIVCVILLFSGCKSENAPTDRALALRSKILDSNGCSFHTAVTADYGEEIHTFSMDCVADKEGNLTFTVTEPNTIAGITGEITAMGGGITFDDKVLAFQSIADDQVTPVVAPWLFIKTLRSGYIRDCADSEKGYEITIDDSYAEDALRLSIRVVNDLPVAGEIFWKGRRILTLLVEAFTYL